MSQEEKEITVLQKGQVSFAWILRLVWDLLCGIWNLVLFFGNVFGVAFSKALDDFLGGLLGRLKDLFQALFEQLLCFLDFLIFYLFLVFKHG